MVIQLYKSIWDYVVGLLVMPTKPVAQKLNLRPSAQLSASKVQAFLKTNMNSAFYQNYATAGGNAESGFCRWRGLCGWRFVRC